MELWFAKEGALDEGIWLSVESVDRGASKSFKSSEEARIELNCLAFQIRQIKRIKLRPAVN